MCCAGTEKESRGKRKKRTGYQEIIQVVSCRGTWFHFLFPCHFPCVLHYTVLVLSSKHIDSLRTSLHGVSLSYKRTDPRFFRLPSSRRRPETLFRGDLSKAAECIPLAQLVLQTPTFSFFPFLCHLHGPPFECFHFPFAHAPITLPAVYAHQLLFVLFLLGRCSYLFLSLVA